MALADQVVVMNHGRIEQTGSAREVFNAPRSEFVARFMGAHNIVATPAGPVAVRADRLQLLRSPLNSMRVAAVRAVEYQGTHVHVSLAPEGEADDVQWNATLADDSFDAAPLAPGETVYLRWEPGAAHALI